jgi:hypothetical protein
MEARKNVKKTYIIRDTASGRFVGEGWNGRNLKKNRLDTLYYALGGNRSRMRRIQLILNNYEWYWRFELVEKSLDQVKAASGKTHRSNNRPIF